MPTTFSRVYRNSGIDAARYPEKVLTTSVSLPPNTTLPALQVVAEAAGNVAARNEVQTITSTATGGTFQLNFLNNGQTTSIPFNATFSQVQTAIESVVGSGNVVCTGGPLGTAVVITYQNGWGKQDIALPTVVSALTGGTASVAETTKGSASATESVVAVNPAAADGTEKPKGILVYPVTTDSRGRPFGEFGLLDANSRGVMAYDGEWPASLLVGLHANHVTPGHAQQFGRLVAGNSITDAGAIVKLL